MNVPVRVDFAGGWLDVPKFSRPNGFVVNCAISPMVSLQSWPYEKNAGLGGSAAWSVLNGWNPIDSELTTAGWQDGAIITETGLCVWQSGPRPVLELKRNPHWLAGKMVELRRSYLQFLGKPRSMAQAVGRYNDVRIRQSQHTLSTQDLYSYLR